MLGIYSGFGNDFNGLSTDRTGEQFIDLLFVENCNVMINHVSLQGMKIKFTRNQQTTKRNKNFWLVLSAIHLM